MDERTFAEKYPNARCAARGGCAEPIAQIETARYADGRTWSYVVCARHAMDGFEDFGRYVDSRQVSA